MVMKIGLILFKLFYRLHFGLIMVTMFISMWISNAACTAMMSPIVQAVLEELQAVSLK